MHTTKKFSHLLLILFLFSCEKNYIQPEENKRNPYSTALSIVVNNDKVHASGSVRTDNKLITTYWIDSLLVDSVTFFNSLDNGSFYKEPVDMLGRKVFVHKTLDGEQDVYRFDQGSLIDDGKIFYYKNGDIVRMDTSAIGTITSIYIANNNSICAGYFGEIILTEIGETLSPKTPFLWDSNSTLIQLPLPDNTFFFKGISCVYVNENEYLVGGLINIPMYWKNAEPIFLFTLYGEVHQITVSESDVYAVGFYNKNNSNSTGHTACYWKNGVLYELEDNAVGYGIYIDGSDVYVSGSFGNVPSQFKACYWKNGVRINLPDL